MGAEFSITSEIPAGKREIAVLTVRGWLDAQSEGKLVEAVQQAREQGAENVIIDLGGVSTITSAGIRAIQRSYGVMTPKGESVPGHLKLCSAPPQVYEVLRITGLLISVPMYEGRDIAVDSFGS
jgi:stage II sporulation protein AA (anti-sigma F factor antagonist)